MTFANTNHINLEVLLDSVKKAEELIKKFADEHKKNQSSFTAEIIKRLASPSIKQQYYGLRDLYQRLIIPELEKEIRIEAEEQTKRKWERAGKDYVKFQSNFSSEVNLLFGEKKKDYLARNSKYKRRNNEYTRLSSAENVIKTGEAETNMPSGFEMGDGNDNGNTPPPRQNSQANECNVCGGAKKDQTEWFISSNRKEYCGKCYRSYWIENFLKKLTGWNQLNSEAQEHYLAQVDKCQKATDFRTLKQMVLKSIQKIAATCSECNKEFYGTRWTVKNVEDKLFCSENCGQNWLKNNQGGQGQVNSQENEGEEMPITDSGEESDNSESGSDQGSDNENGEKNNNFSESIKQIASLPLPQAREKAKEEIKNMLKVNSISENELEAENWSGADSWESYLESLDTSQKVAEFTEKIRQAVLRKALAKKTSTTNDQKKPENNELITVIIISLALLALTTLVIIIVRKKKKQNF